MEGIAAKNSEFMGKDSITRLIIKFALPSIFGMLSHSLYNIVDRFFVGRYVGTDALAATSVCFPYMLFGFALAMLPNVGGAALISIALGKRDKREAERVLGNGLFIALLASVFLTFLGFSFALDIIRLSGGVEAIEEIAYSYLSIVVFGVPFSMFAFAMNGYIRAQGRPRYAMGALFFGALSNIVLDALFIVVFGWGVKGAAVATVISQVLSFAWVMGFFVFKNGELEVRLANLRPVPSVLVKILMLGLSPFLTEVSFAVFMLLFNRAIAHYGGAMGMSALGIFMGLDSLLFLPVLGIGEAVQPIFGYNFGAKLFSRVEEALKSAIILASGYFLMSVFVVYFFAEQMIAVFSSDHELIAMTAQGMMVSYSGVIFVGIAIIAGSYLQGLGMAKLSLALSISRHFLFLIPAILILPHYFGIIGVWGTFPVVDACGGLMSVMALLYLNKRRSGEYE